MVVREAAAQRTPALAAEGSCTAEVIIAGDNGIISKDESPAVAQAIADFLALPQEKRKAMGDRAYDTIPIPWDGPLMDTILGRYQALIESNNLKYRKSL
jgi:glycosyltransferase involved in cell wall biosynthesis